MNSIERERTAGEYVEWLRLTVHGKELPATERVRAAAPCLGIAQDHHHAIVLLIEQRLYASSFALVRVAFEAYIRGEWLALCASNTQLSEFLHGNEPPKIRILIEQLEETPAFSDKVLSTLKHQHWDAMCAYTHTGGLHISRWITADSIEASYDPREISEVLFFSEVIGSLAVVGFATLRDDGIMANAVFEKLMHRTNVA